MTYIHRNGPSNILSVTHALLVEDGLVADQHVGLEPDHQESRSQNEADHQMFVYGDTVALKGSATYKATPVH